MNLVDDGSTDGSLRRVEELARYASLQLAVVDLRRSFSLTATIAAGIDHSIADLSPLPEKCLFSSHDTVAQFSEIAADCPVQVPRAGCPK